MQRLQVATLTVSDLGAVLKTLSSVDADESELRRALQPTLHELTRNI